MSDTPKRIQRKRTKGWRMPEGAVYVGRPTIWGNPFATKDFGPDWSIEFFRRSLDVPAIGMSEKAIVAVYAYRERVLGLHPGFPHISKEMIRAELRGKDLACWCPLDQPCHADVLIELANAPTAPGEHHDAL